MFMYRSGYSPEASGAGAAVVSGVSGSVGCVSEDFVSFGFVVGAAVGAVVSPEGDVGGAVVLSGLVLPDVAGCVPDGFVVCDGCPPDEAVVDCVPGVSAEEDCGVSGVVRLVCAEELLPIGVFGVVGAVGTVVTV